MKPLLNGLIAAPYTPFKNNGDVALDVIQRQARVLARNGVRGAFICGTTGEGSSLTSDERRQVTEAWLKARPAKLAVIVHVGHQSARESHALARHAQQCGADAIATIAPSFFKAPSIVELVEWCASVAAAAPKLPFYYYHMPAMTGVQFSAAAFLAQAHRRIPTLAGVKFTHEDLMDFSQAGRVAGGRYEVVFGRDEILLAGLSLGAKGAVGSMYNFAAPHLQSHHARAGRRPPGGSAAGPGAGDGLHRRAAPSRRHRGRQGRDETHRSRLRPDAPAPAGAYDRAGKSPPGRAQGGWLFPVLPARFRSAFSPAFRSRPACPIAGA